MKLDHIQLAMPLGEEAKAREYFTGVLGMDEEEKPEPLASRGGCWFRSVSVILHVGGECAFSPQSKAHPAFSISDLEALEKKLKEKEYEVIWDHELPGRKRFYSTDPFGNRIEFMQEGDGFSEKRAWDKAMKVELNEAKEEDLPVVLNLIQYYVYDMSKSTGWDCNPRGIYGGCDDSREYWQPDHPDTPPEMRSSKSRKGHPFMISVDGKIAGFVLLQELCQEGKPLFDIGEFFVVGKYQGKGVGKYIAHTLFRRFRGDWRIRQIPKNTPAIKFWEQVIGEFTNGNFKVNKTEDTVSQSFKT